MRRSDMPREMPNLPFSGESAYQRYQQTLGERQLKMIKKLEEASLAYQSSIQAPVRQGPWRKRYVLRKTIFVSFLFS
jgi:hypothetical protein